MGIPPDFSTLCQKCGACCTGIQEGSVLMFPLDVIASAAYLNLEPKDFVKEYCKEVEYEYELRNELLRSTGYKEYIPIFALNMSQRDDCPFYNTNLKKCAIYSARPFQCRQFPFLDCVLTETEMLNDISLTCAGFKHWIQVHKYALNKDLFEIVEDERKMEREYYHLIKKAKNRLDCVYFTNLS